MIKPDAYLTGFVYKPKHNYEINGQNNCPRCSTGVIIRDFDDKVCLNCGLREINEVDFITYLEEAVIQWLISNLPRQLFSTLDFLNQNIGNDNTKYLKLPAYKGIINAKIESLLLELAKLEQKGVIKIHPHGVISDYENVIVVYDVLDAEKVDKRLIPVGVL